jgi:hypothetical protein
MHIPHGYIAAALDRKELAEFLKACCYWGCDRAYEWLAGRDREVNEPLVLGKLQSAIHPFEIFVAGRELHARPAGWVADLGADSLLLAARRVAAAYGIPPMHADSFVDDLAAVWLTKTSRFAATVDPSGLRQLDLTDAVVRHYTSAATREGKDLRSFAFGRELPEANGG